MSQGGMILFGLEWGRKKYYSSW